MISPNRGDFPRFRVQVPPSDTHAGPSLKQVAMLLQRCRDVGIETAFAEMARGDIKRAANMKQLVARLAKGA